MSICAVLIDWRSWWRLLMVCGYRLISHRRAHGWQNAVRGSNAESFAFEGSCRFTARLFVPAEGAIQFISSVAQQCKTSHAGLGSGVSCHVDIGPRLRRDTCWWRGFFLSEWQRFASWLTLLHRLDNQELDQHQALQVPKSPLQPLLLRRHQPLRSVQRRTPRRIPSTRPAGIMPRGKFWGALR